MKTDADSGGRPCRCDECKAHGNTGTFTEEHPPANADSGRVIWNKETMHGPSVVPANADTGTPLPVLPGCDWLTEGGNICPVNPCQCRPAPTADSGGRYEWDWVNTGDQEYIDGELRTLTESYIVRRPDHSIHCFTSRYKAGYERALAIAAAMNQASPNDRSRAS